MERKVIFVGGSSYSGSTMLDMMLANSPRGFSAGEVQALFRPYRPHHFNPTCGCSNKECDLWLRVRQGGEEKLYETLFQQFPGTTFIVDSSKDPWWIRRQMRRLEAKGVAVRNLLIWKEPGAFAHSMLKRRRRGWLKAWKNYYRIYMSLIADFRSVSYGDLVQNPKEYLRNLCREAGIPYHEDQEKFWAKRHHTLFGNKSAKIHLHQKPGESPVVGSTEDDFTSNRCYRSIYKDARYMHSLPRQVTEHLANDAVIHSVLTDLKKGHPSLNVSKLCAFSLGTAKARNELKFLLGLCIGRYHRIF